MYNEIQKIAELSVVVQGEGQHTGYPALLIRMTGCNLNCQFKDGICDSAHTSWLDAPGKYSLNDVQNLIETNPKIKYTFITGGNPSFRPELLRELVNLLKRNGHYVAIEDNGTTFTFIPGIDLVTLSPKLQNSIPRVGTRIVDPINNIDQIVTQRDRDKHLKYLENWRSIERWIERYDYQLKFVISNEDQLAEIEAMIDIIGADRDKVYLMPEGSTREQLASRRQQVYELALKYGYKYTDRLHIIVYDNKAGV